MPQTVYRNLPKMILHKRKPFTLELKLYYCHVIINWQTKLYILLHTRPIAVLAVNNI